MEKIPTVGYFVSKDKIVYFVGKLQPLDTGPIANFDFIKILNEDRTYRLLFPVREVGMAILEIYEAIGNNFFEDKKFTETDLHLAFSRAHGAGERYPKEVYSAHNMDLQEYFLDYDQPSQKYFFLRIMPSSSANMRRLL